MKTYRNAFYAFGIVLAVTIGTAVHMNSVSNANVGDVGGECDWTMDKNDCPTSPNCGIYYVCKSTANGRGADSCSTGSQVCYVASKPVCANAQKTEKDANLTWQNCKR